MQWQHRYTVLTLCTGAFFTTMMARLSISPVVPMIVEEFQISNGAMGLALTGMWFSYALSQYPSGILADQYGERPIILLAVGGTAIGCLFLIISPTFWLFAVSTIVIGLFAGLHYSVATTLLSRKYHNIGTAIGVHNLGAPLAGLLAPIAVVWIAGRFGWRPALSLAIFVAVPVFVLFTRSVNASSEAGSTDSILSQLDISSNVRLLAYPPITFTLVIAAANSFVLQGATSFLPTFLLFYHGYSSSVAGIAFSVFFIINALIQVVVGSVSDRYGRDHTIAASVLAGLAGIVLLLVSSNLVLLGFAIVLAGIGLSAQTAIQPRVLDHLSDSERNSGFGIVRTVYMIGASTSSVILGATADLFNWGVAFGICGVALAAILVLLIINMMFDLGW